MPSHARMQDTLERLERWLREHQPAFLEAMSPGATDAELDQLERDVGHTLPEDLRAFYRWRSGIEEAVFGADAHLSDKNPFWGRPLPLCEIRHEYEECCGYAKYDWNDPKRPSWWHVGWVPIFYVNYGPRLICVDTAGVWTGTRGQIVYFSNKDTMRTIEAASLGDWLRVLVLALERGVPFGYPAHTSQDAHSFFPFGYPIFRDATDEPVIPETLGDLETRPACLPRPKPEPTAFRVGDRVRVTDGSFSGSEAVVKRLVAGSWTVEVTLAFYGRELDVEVEHWQLRLIARSAQEPSTSDWNMLTEAEELLSLLGFGPSIRKLRLLVAACYRDRLGRWPEAAHALCSVLEGMAEDNQSPTELRDAVSEYWQLTTPRTGERRASLESLLPFCPPPFGQSQPLEASARQQYTSPELIREIFPNPSVPPRFDPAWRTADVTALANAIYVQRAFDQMPILADALQDVGCDNDDMLTHCRDTSATHVRGCWVLDLCLGRE